MLQHFLNNKWTKRAVFLVCLVPLSVLVWKGFHSDLTANPIEKITHFTGDWTIYFLLITLAVTPLRKLIPQLNLIRFRRMFGLYAFFYASLHFSTFLVLDHFFDFARIVEDIAKRPFITVGFTGFVLLIPLAVTSTAGMIRRLGGRRWNLLHRLIYVTACLGVIHYYWLVKSDITLPVRYGAILAFLFIVRAAFWLRARQSKPARSVAKKNTERAETSPAA
ncbi:MAG: sulfoxide reductase heme-binding subunit YedZ [Acidobacteria bacterium]|nr:sulfoxide reductase heme-binding subunit YedZ [Acidobacteriota bacterium]